MCCQKNNIKKTAIPPHSNEFVAAVQPPRGGIAPGIAPIEVFSQDFLFNGVYKNKYKRIVANDKIHVNKLTLRYRISKPIVINDKPKILAVLIEIFFVGRTLFFVLSISLSDSDSNTLFITEDPVEERRVPRTV